MYQYTAIDQRIVNERVTQFRDQTRRFLAGELTNDEFLPLRLQNGLYIQRHAPMLRVAIPYGLLSSKQMRMLAHIANKYDKGYGHFTTRQNIQFNWPKLEEVPEILADLATVQMHAIQTSGNCVRNITSDQYAGVAKDELLDPRALCEILRQWSTFHPEFAHLPRKFKIAVSSSHEDRAVTFAHDIGLNFYLDQHNTIRIKVIVGGGLGRTPIIGSVIHEDLHWQDMLTYTEAILRVYNRFGRRDNKYKARIKILVKALGPEEFKRQVDEEWAHFKDSPSKLTQAEYDRVANHFKPHTYQVLSDNPIELTDKIATEPAFARWVQRSIREHKTPGYAIVTLSVKPNHVAPGDVTTKQMNLLADWADSYSFGELRITHEQNVVLADVKQSDLYSLWQHAKQVGLATPNIGLLTDIIACPGGDFCSLANAKSIPIANAIQARFDDLDYLFDIGDITLNISGCMNSCGHHHIGNIGILGVDKGGDEWYQISVGGHAGNAIGHTQQTNIGKILGPSFHAHEVPDVIEKLIRVYIAERTAEEVFVDTLTRIGIDAFKHAVYEKTAGGHPNKRTVGEDANG